MKAIDIARDEWPALRWQREGGMLVGSERLKRVRVVVDGWRVITRGDDIYIRDSIGAGGLRRALRRARYEIARERGEVSDE